MENKERLELLLSNYKDYLDDHKIDQLLKYYSLLIEKNKVMNLTAITDFDDVAVKHFADSLSLVRVLVPKEQSFIDIGTGAGFPGIPLKICFPDISLTLLDSLNKRVNFLNEVIDSLGLKGVTAVHARAEEAARLPIYREKYQVALSRAVSNLSTLVEYSLPFVSVNGSFVSYKGSNSDAELSAAGKAISTLGGKFITNDKFILDNSDFERSLILIKKIKNTPALYPRSGGKPLSNPL